jgi:hypothetical protein
MGSVEHSLGFRAHLFVGVAPPKRLARPVFRSKVFHGERILTSINYGKRDFLSRFDPMVERAHFDAKEYDF